MWDEPLNERIDAYTRMRQLRIGQKLGSGNEGTVIAALLPGTINEIAIKFHLNPEGYEREKLVYRRLAEKRVVQVLGFNVPEFIAADDEWMLLQMTIVRRPFVLDFGGARLEENTAYFSEEIMEEWRQQKREMFEERWPIVENILFEFNLLGIHLMDVHPRNVAFLDEV